MFYIDSSMGLGFLNLTSQLNMFYIDHFGFLNVTSIILVNTGIFDPLKGFLFFSGHILNPLHNGSHDPNIEHLKFVFIRMPFSPTSRWLFYIIVRCHLNSGHWGPVYYLFVHFQSSFQAVT